MTLRLLDPVGNISNVPQGRPMLALETLEGRRVGLLWSRVAGANRFWQALEEVVEAKFRPSEVHRLYKRSQFNPATLAEVEALAQKIDYAIIGVGA